MYKTNELFTPGKLTILLDGGAGSSGKGKIASFISKQANNCQFVCNTFAPQAGHWVKLDDGSTYFYQTLNSCACIHTSYEKMYIGPGAIIEKEAFFREIEENSIPQFKIGINPVVCVLQDIDKSFEMGCADLDGDPASHEGTIKFGSTCHGVGAATARRVLRRPNIKLVKDDPDLKPFVCDTTDEIMQRLNNRQAGLLELAQGFQLSLMSKFYPYTTSRNVTVAAGLNDMMLPPVYVGNVVINFRTYPIRINSKKYIGEDGHHLTWDEVESGVPHEVCESNSGHGYNDQVEITWDDITNNSGSSEPIIEMTSVTQLPRRLFTFSRTNFEEAIVHNNTGHKTYISINFANYVDDAISGVRGVEENGNELLTERMTDWLEENIWPVVNKHNNVELKFIGTGDKTDDMIVIKQNQFGRS